MSVSQAELEQVLSDLGIPAEAAEAGGASLLEAALRAHGWSDALGAALVAGGALAQGGPLRPGELVDGRYRVLDLLGEGGMGAVYRAWSPSLRSAVALKVLSRQTDREQVQRFFREAQLAARVAHAGVTGIHACGWHRDLPYCAQELIRGEDLGQRLRRGPVPPPTLVALLAQVARALHQAHQAGIVHRDVKPANILLDEEGRARLSDFGLAGATDQERLTRTGEIMGTPSYMAPEQAQDAHRVDARTDVYALGAVLYHGLCGRPPFAAQGLVQVLRQVLEESPTPPSQLQPGVPPALEAVCLRALAKSPDARYPTALALAEALEAPEAPARSGTRAAGVGLALLLAVGIGGGAAALAARRGPPPATPAVADTPPDFLQEAWARCAAHEQVSWLHLQRDLRRWQRDHDAPAADAWRAGLDWLAALESWRGKGEEPPAYPPARTSDPLRRAALGLLERLSLETLQAGLDADPQTTRLETLAAAWEGLSTPADGGRLAEAKQAWLEQASAAWLERFRAAPGEFQRRTLLNRLVALAQAKPAAQAGEQLRQALCAGLEHLLDLSQDGQRLLGETFAYEHTRFYELDPACPLPGEDPARRLRELFNAAPGHDQLPPESLLVGLRLWQQRFPAFKDALELADAGWFEAFLTRHPRSRAAALLLAAKREPGVDESQAPTQLRETLALLRMAEDQDGRPTLPDLRGSAGWLGEIHVKILTRLISLVPAERPALVQELLEVTARQVSLSIQEVPPGIPDAKDSLETTLGVLLLIPDSVKQAQAFYDAFSEDCARAVAAFPGYRSEATWARAQLLGSLAKVYERQQGFEVALPLARRALVMAGQSIPTAAFHVCLDYYETRPPAELDAFLHDWLDRGLALDGVGPRLVRMAASDPAEAQRRLDRARELRGPTAELAEVAQHLGLRWP